MRILNTVLIAGTTILLSACSTDHNDDYLKAQQSAPIKIPAPLSSYDTQNLYTVPQGEMWHGKEPVTIIPPGSSMAKKNMPQPLNYSKT